MYHQYSFKFVALPGNRTTITWIVLCSIKLSACSVRATNGCYVGVVVLNSSASWAVGLLNRQNTLSLWTLPNQYWHRRVNWSPFCLVCYQKCQLSAICRIFIASWYVRGKPWFDSSFSLLAGSKPDTVCCWNSFAMLSLGWIISGKSGVCGVGKWGGLDIFFTWKKFQTLSMLLGVFL